LEQLHNGFTLNVPAGTFPLSTDSIALAGFVKLPKNAKVLDLGAGCGTLGLFLCANHPGCSVTGIELDENAHQAALANIESNRLNLRLTSICADLCSIPSLFAPGSFECCVSNPPYFSSGPKSSTVPLARQECACSMEDLFNSAAWALKYGGDFFLVHRPERLAELFSCACVHGLEPKKLCLIRHRQGDPVSLVLVQCRKGGKPGLIWEEHYLSDEQGNPSDYYKNLYHLQE